MCERLAQGRYLAEDRPRLEPATFRSLTRRYSHYSTRPLANLQDILRDLHKSCLQLDFVSTLRVAYNIMQELDRIQSMVAAHW